MTGRRAHEPLYEPLPSLLVRAPVLPVADYTAIATGGAGFVSACFSGSPECASGSPVSRIAATALAVGSPDAHAAAAAPRRGPLGARLLGRLLRYLIRMSTRPTPYGLFSGVALARWGDATTLEFSDAPPRTRTRLDMEWLTLLLRDRKISLSADAHCRWRTNTHFLERADRLFSAESAAPGQQAPGERVSFRATSVVKGAMAAAREPIAYADLVAELCRRAPHAAIHQIEGLLHELLRRGAFVTDLDPALTAADPVALILRCLRAIPAAAALHAQLASIVERIRRWDDDPNKSASEHVRIASELRDLGGDGAHTPLQTDCNLQLRGADIAAEVGAEVARAAEILLSITPYPHGSIRLQLYRQAFETRYGLHREVNLLELLDPSFGLGSPFTATYAAPWAADAANGAARGHVLMRLAATALRRRERVVELDDAALNQLQTWTPDPARAPLSLELIAQVAATSREAIDAGAFHVVIAPSLGASAAGRVLGRFADLLGDDATASLTRCAGAHIERCAGKIVAELVYLPHKVRLANVALRPAVRSHEILFNANPGGDEIIVVPLDELVVGIRDHRFYVRWPAHDREVAVCSSHMINELQAPPVCRFLLSLARQDAPQFTPFDWGPASNLPFLPRVQTGRIVLRVGEWRISDDVRTRELEPDEPELFARNVARWRELWDVPRHIYLVDGDNRLLLDLEQPLQLEELRTELRRGKRRGATVLHEVYPALDQTWATGRAGAFVTELAVPLLLRPVTAPAPDDHHAAPLRRHRRVASLLERIAPPGGEWLYVKLYCPRELEDDLVMTGVRWLVEEVRRSGAASEWFFIRYSDPDPHIRLRFRGAADALAATVFPLICERATEWIAQGLCQRFSFDVYEREVERYGGAEGVRVSEHVFWCDSEAALDLLVLERAGALKLDRLSLAVLALDDLLAGMKLSAIARTEWCRERLRSGHARSPEYRERKALLRGLLADDRVALADVDDGEVRRVLATRRARLEEPAEQLSRLEELGELSAPFSALCHSYVHLHCNRLLGTELSVERTALELLLRTREGLTHDRHASRRCSPDEVARGAVTPIA